MGNSIERERVQRPQGVTRRDFGRAVAFLSAAATMPFYNEMTLAQDIKAMSRIPADAVRINSNENPMGPCPEAIEAMSALLPLGGRYLFDRTNAFTEALAASEGLPETHVQPSAGSSDPLHRSVLAFTSPGRPLVTASPGYEAPERAAAFMGAKVIKVPLRKDFSHDVQAMAAADPQAGVIYICNPNNPTGTITRKEDIDYIVNNKPKGCLALARSVRGLHIHLSTSATPTTPLVAAGKDVIVLRTFSKLYGMAGLRAGAAIGRPDLLEKLRGYGGLSMMPITGMAGALASLKNKTLIEERRKMMADIRNDVCSWMRRRATSLFRPKPTCS